MGKAIGIDLGTTNSCAAVVLDGSPTVITYPDGAKTIASVFAIDKSGKKLVGIEAREQAAANPMNTVAASKRLIGRSFDSKAVDQMQQVFTYELLEGEGSSVLVKVADQVLTLEQISASILMRIKDNAERVLGEPVRQAVITVPAYFNDRQRQSVRAAGKLAGLDVLRVLNEPTAAALAYGLGRSINHRVAIYDLGGGTFDISIIDIRDKVFEVIATGGDTFLGGVDFDDRVMQWVLGTFMDDHGIDLSFDRSAITRIRDAAEEAKILLSSEEIAHIRIADIARDDAGEPIDLDIPFTREQLEELTGDLVKRSIATCERIFREAGTSRDQIGELLLVGGQSRMPLVRRRIQDFLTVQPSDKVHPDEAVALGAAIMAHSLSSKVTEKDVTLHDVLPVPIGIGRPDGKLAVLFAKNDSLPARKVKTLVTSKPNQKTLALQMFQGESDLVKECELLGSFVFYGLREAPPGGVKLRVTFHIDSEGILDLSAFDADNGEQVASRIKLDEAPAPGSRRKRKKAEEAVAPAPLDMPGASIEAELEEIEPDPTGEGRPLTDDGPLPELDEPGRSADGASSGPASTEAPADPSAEAAEPLPPEKPNIRNLRSQLSAEPAASAAKPEAGGGLFGWFKRLFGGK